MCFPQFAMRPPAMPMPHLPQEVWSRIDATARYLRRRDRLLKSRLWANIRWYTANHDTVTVPEGWAECGWLLKIVRALLDPSVHSIHLQTAVAG